MINAVSSLYSDPQLLYVLLRGFKFTEAETEQYVRLVREQPSLRHASRPWDPRASVDDGPPWYTCPDCDADWQPTLSARRTKRPRKVIHDCWTRPRSAGRPEAPFLPGRRFFVFWS